MKRVLIVLFIALVLFSVGAQEQIKIGFFNIAPHIWMDEGDSKPKGAIVDHWNQILAPAMGVTIDWVGPLPFPEVLNKLTAGEIDVMALITHNDEREALMHYPDFELFETGAFIVFMKNNPVSSLPNWGALSNKKVVVGDTYPFREAMGAAGVDLVEPGATMVNEVGFEMLKAREVDAVAVQQRISVFYYLKQSGNLFLARNIKILPVGSEDISAAYTTFNRSRSDLERQYNSVINSNERNRYEFFLSRYIR